MPIVAVNGIQLSYQDVGAGEPVLLVAGTGVGGRVWHAFQAPALIAAGYRVVTVDNRGIAPTDLCADGITLEDLVGDVAALIELLDIGPCRLVGASLGALVVQELALARPELVRGAVLMATRGRTNALWHELAEAQQSLHDSGIALPPRYHALVQAMWSLSPSTLADDQRVTDWLDLHELTAHSDAGRRAQLGAAGMPDRLADYAAIDAPCHVIAFADDLVTPPDLCREVADAIPGAGFEIIPNCGHSGYLEDPEPVNQAILRCLATD
jgi:pimeloyl-ACP methyl ester carboxylesterase